MEKKRKRKSVTPTPSPAEAVIAEPMVDQGAQTAQAAAPTEPTESVPQSAEAETLLPESAPRQKVAAPAEAPVEAEAAAKPKKKKKKKVAKKRVSAAPTAPASTASAAPEAASRDVLHDKLDKLEAKLEEKNEQVARAAREGFASDPALDDTSVPPVDLDAHDDFFSAGERAHQQKATGASGSFDAIDPKSLRKMTAEAHARRAHLSRYVKWAVGGALGLLLLGVVVKSMRGRPADEPVVRHEVVHTAEIAPPPAEPKAAAAPAAEQGKVEELDQPKVDEPTPAASAEEKKADDGKAAANADTPAAAVVDQGTEKKDEPLVDKPKTAWQEKQAAKAALERGANGAAVAAGERSVALDPSDGEAWLVLGGAYQAMGQVGQAKRCYKACVAHGKKGPLGDCRDMLGSL